MEVLSTSVASGGGEEADAADMTGGDGGGFGQRRAGRGRRKGGCSSI